MKHSLSGSVEAARVREGERYFERHSVPAPEVSYDHDYSKYSVRSSVPLPLAEPFSREAHKLFYARGFRRIFGIEQAEQGEDCFIVTYTGTPDQFGHDLRQLADTILEDMLDG